MDFERQNMKFLSMPLRSGASQGISQGMPKIKTFESKFSGVDFRIRAGYEKIFCMQAGFREMS